MHRQPISGENSPFFDQSENGRVERIGPTKNRRPRARVAVALASHGLFPSLGDELLRFDQRRKLEVLENCRLEERFAARIPPHLRNSLFHGSIAGEHFRNRCHILRLTEDIPQSAHEPSDSSVMNLGIDAIHVACGTLCAVLLALKNEDAVLPIGDVRPIKSKT